MDVDSHQGEGNTLVAGGSSKRGLLLRLDDGSLIGACDALQQPADGGLSATRVDAEKAYELGKLKPKHVARLEQLVFRMGALVQGDTWVEESFSLAKRRAPLVRAA